MINKDRIVPIEKIDFLSLIATVIGLVGTTYTVLKSSDIEGNFAVETAGVYLADQPVKALDFTAASGTVYFTPAYDFAGITVNGAEATIAEGSAEVESNAVGLYRAVLSSGSVTVTAITPNVE